MKKKKVMIFFCSMIFITGATFFLYKKFYSYPLEKKALKELIYAQKYLSEGSIDKALNQKKLKIPYLGFYGIVTKYPSTKAGNISKFYAGICYYKLGNYKESIKMMNNFSAKDEFLSSIRYGMIGDSFTQIKNKNEALKNYIKAANIRENEITTPLYYYKAALLTFSMNKYRDSKFFLEKIEKKYPLFLYKDNVDKYLMFIENKL
ncbi:hypothetical protein DM815_02720 [Blattabacterium sp. (Cryptocercus kyebangensis)]|uniref:tetratricopeptide repeat protein n=1 Tax=Blattabacterium sp. (Cryptocercus kyebangensis) TaxID=298656 RepID=UPI000D7BCF6E|nr:hypothetical protein [Blattabacterium sp. (Cryptocercus kyebangensis)]AWU43918.1 hypothetical protein DM815_02720 [Blattabacterium sp. (Cryptocercus kyebangensis)]